jgi:MoxR-like ATPase
MPGGRTHLLRALNLFGLDHLDPVLLAALADGRPLLLIGAHGTAKSELLNRIAAALGLAHRHYNASLISFDDLLGYPVPNAAHDGITYLRTPGDLWDAESVFLDEISRCRPESQNKLFSIIHERRVQGLPLERLRYRWAAMNPPVSLDGAESAEETYHGSLPLDPALADRFAYVVRVPSLEEIGVRERRNLLARGGDAPHGDGGLPDLVRRARLLAAETAPADRDWAAAYVEGLIAPLREAGFPISGRRAVSLCASIGSVQAALTVLGRRETLADAAVLALKWGLPQRAQGRSIEDSVIHAVHKLAVQSAGEPENSPWRHIRAEPDPVRRIGLALDAPETIVDRLAMSQLVTDAYAGLSVPERYVLAWVLSPVFAASDRLTTGAYEQLTEPVTKVLAFAEASEQHVAVHRSRAGAWDRVLAAVSALRRTGDPQAPEIGNLLYTLFAVEKEAFEPERVVDRFRAWRDLFGDHVTAQAA